MIFGKQNFAVRTLPDSGTTGGEYVVDCYGAVWRVLPFWQTPPDDTNTRRGTLHPDGRITE